MSYIREPKGVDFTIQSEPLTNEEREMISNFIKKDKELRSTNKSLKTRNNSAEKEKTYQ